MNTKGRKTRERILQKTAPLFNIKGYYNTSVSEIMSITGLKKGGLYNHFSSKEEIALEAFRYNLSIMRQRFKEILSCHDAWRAQLTAIVEEAEHVAAGNVIPGGCPVLNASVEADDCYPPLREEAQKGAASLKRIIMSVLEKGKSAGELQELSREDLSNLADFILAAVEGGIMLSKINNSLNSSRSVSSYLKRIIESL